jgi:hypothetical protein
VRLSVAAQVKQHVGGLHITVHYPRFVRRVESIGNWPDYTRYQIRQQMSCLPDKRLNVTAGHIPHGDEENAVGLASVIDRDDVRVIDSGGGPGFTDEPNPVVLPVKVISQDLQGNLAS